MAREMVQVHGHLPAAPDAVWAGAARFLRGLAPVDRHHPRRDRARGARLSAPLPSRAKTRLYREQLTYFSDTDRVLGYTHLEGIAGCEAYDARLTVTAAEAGGSIIGWTATVRARPARLGPICEGTKAVYEAGIATLATATASAGKGRAALPAPVAVETLLIDDLPRLACRVTPDLGDRRLCLFLHGIGGARRQLAAHNWQPPGTVMRVPRWTCAAMATARWGRSNPRWMTIAPISCAWPRCWAPRRLVLVGLSYGSWIATSFAMRHPDMLDGLVLSGGCTGMSEAGPDEREAFRVSREVPLNAGQVPADFAPAVVKVLAGPEASDATRAALLHSMAAIPAATYRDALICFTNPLERFDFSKLTMPVLLMTGEHDRLAPPAEIRAVAGRIWDAAPRPDVRFEVIADAGHVCNVEEPEAYSRHLLTFLAGLP